MKGGHNQFQGGYLFDGVLIHRNTPAIVLNSNRVIFMDGHADFCTVAGKGLINGVIHHLINKVVQSLFSSIANVHGRSFAYCLKTVKYLYLISAVIILFLNIFLHTYINTILEFHGHDNT